MNAWRSLRINFKCNRRMDFIILLWWCHQIICSWSCAWRYARVYVWKQSDATVAQDIKSPSHLLKCHDCFHERESAEQECCIATKSLKMRRENRISQNLQTVSILRLIIRQCSFMRRGELGALLLKYSASFSGYRLHDTPPAWSSSGYSKDDLLSLRRKWL